MRHSSSRPQNERGATAVEYALMVGLVAVGIIASVSTLRDKVNATFGKLPIENIVYQASAPTPYVNIPTTAGGVTTLKITYQPGPGNYPTGVGYFSLPDPFRTGQLQWALAGCTPNGATTLRIGAEANNASIPLAQPIEVGDHVYSWTKSAVVNVTISPTDVYLWIPSLVTGQEVRYQYLIVGTPGEVSAFISAHSVSGTC